jgi:hypothetical protein
MLQPKILAGLGILWLLTGICCNVTSVWRVREKAPSKPSDAPHVPYTIMRPHQQLLLMLPKNSKGENPLCAGFNMRSSNKSQNLI